MPKCVLLAEDDPGDVTLLQYSVETTGTGWCLHHVHDGQAAIEYLSGQGAYADRNVHHLPKLLLLDLKMPRKSGFDVLEWLNSVQSVAQMPVIVFSASLREQDVTQAYKLGASAFVIKPSTVDARDRVVKSIAEFWFKTAALPD
jgi:CheY-like chemotaxis protein